MKGDFSRNTFRSDGHYTRVLMQQGRVQLDADWNEQNAILLDFITRLAEDLIGSHGGSPRGFRIGAYQPDGIDYPSTFAILPGFYYVQGARCEFRELLEYHSQPDLPVNKLDDPLPAAPYIVYLDVWERHVTYVQDDYVRESALGGPDTASRARLMCQVKVESRDIPPGSDTDTIKNEWARWVELWQPAHRGFLRARAGEDVADTDPCVTEPESRYRGVENQLYRVEVHTGGDLSTATFKWSRDNGSVVFPIRELSGELATIDGLGHGASPALAKDDWVEVVDDADVARGLPGLLRRVADVDPVDSTVTLSGNTRAYTESSADHPILRRWDHTEGDPSTGAAELAGDGALKIRERDPWIPLEDGVEINFAVLDEEFNHYRTGDYWMIPARVATGNIEWPSIAGDPEAAPPHGVWHRFAPLALAIPDANGDTEWRDCRCVFPNLCKISDKLAGL